MVSLHLRETRDEDPIELTPLYIQLDSGKMVIDNLNPFFIALEFALQGKSVRVEGFNAEAGKMSANPEPNGESTFAIAQLLHGMGVPYERINIPSNDSPASRSHNRKQYSRHQVNLIVF
jgi:hypothetical protein